MTEEREALKLALEALDSDNPDIQLRAAIIIRGVLAQPERDAVAIGWYIEGYCAVLGALRPSLSYEEWRPFYAMRVPPQRKPLTDEEIQELFGVGKVDATFTQFVRTIEAAHGIKEET